MIIERLNLIAFGHFSGQTIDLSASPRRFHLIVGPNESGKTTCMRAIESLFFGIASQTTDNYVHANQKLRIGATLVDDSGERLSVVRRKGLKSTLLAEDGKSPIGDEEMHRLLGGIDCATFRTRYGISYGELVEGGKAVLQSKGELGEILFSAGAGVGRLKTIRTEIESESAQLFLRRGKKNRLHQLVKELDEKRVLIEKSQVPPAEYTTLNEKLAETESNAGELTLQIASTKQRIGELLAFQKAFNVVPLWRYQQSKLAEHREVPDLDEDFSARRRDSFKDREFYSNQLSELKDEIGSIESQMKSIDINAALISNESQIVSAHREVAANSASQQELLGLKRDLASQNRQLIEMLRDLGVGISTDANETEIDLKIDQFRVTESEQVRIAELASEHRARTEQEEQSKQTLETLRKQLLDLDDELESTPAPQDPSVFDSILKDIGSPESLSEQLDHQQVQLDNLLSECDRLKRALRLQSLSNSQVRNLVPPEARTIEVYESEFMVIENSIEKHDDIVTKLTNELNGIDQELSRLDSEVALPTEESLHESRSERDQLVDRLNEVANDSTQVQKTTSQLRASIQNSDRVVDTIRSHHQRIAHQSSLKNKRSVLAGELEEARRRLVEDSSRLKDVQSRWRQLWEFGSFDVEHPKEMRAWLADYDRLADKLSQADESERRLEKLTSKIERYRNRLSKVVRRISLSQPVATEGFQALESNGDRQELVSVYDLAIELRAEVNSQHNRIEQLRQRRLDVQSEISQAESKLEADRQRRIAWDAEWTQLVQAIVDESNQAPSVINARLSMITKMYQRKHERDRIRADIDGINRKHESFKNRVGSLLHVIGFAESANASSEELSPAECLDRVFKQLEREKSLALTQSNLKASLKDLDQKQRKASELLDSANNQLDRLCTEAGVEDPEALREIEQSSKEKQQASAEMKATEKELRLIAGDVDLEGFATNVETADQVEVERELRIAQIDLGDLESRWPQVQQELGALKKELSMIDGSDEASMMHQEFHSLLGRITPTVRRYAKLRMATFILNRAIERYRQENQNPVLRYACDAFSELTCNRYSGLRPEFDENGNARLFGTVSQPNDQEELVPVDAMSSGTRDALYFAMRVASLEHQLTSGPVVPVVVDDCLIQLDDKRSAAAMKLFSRLSERTQVILFTHHKHLVELAEATLDSGQFHVHQLKPR